MTMMSSLKAFLFASPAQAAMTGPVRVPSTGADGGEFAALLGGITQPSIASGLDGALPLPNVIPPALIEGEAQALPLDGQASLPAQSPSTPLGDMRPAEKLSTDGRVAVAVAPPISPKDRKSVV